ncbi:hypothetical protein C5Y96_13300 [Blastopirellula marina]|uniref:Uncharacterized protein n=1 Tax=Blastopirellula marina TaxID=124 RepID=A0A2S8FGN7_9BACT|nr:MULTISPECIES: hypothetical protein [Pirellulaceae]PQO31312.1 hypothetical protein C5Y96_13300 [Blastopirellula marina]RCS51706.1 hypothetical protein DTL36_13310 [Bremerella cremea]
MFIFLLFAVLNLSVGFAAAVLLGYGPQPWFALFLPSNTDNVIQIDAIETEEAEIEKPAEPADEPTPKLVSQPFPEMNEPEDLPAESEPVAEDEPEIEQTFEPVAEEAPAATAQEKPFGEDEDNELEEFLAGRKNEPKNLEHDEPTSEKAPEIASADDIESMFAASLGDDAETASNVVTAQTESDEDDELDDQPLGQDDIAALFNS